jgi:hypothetical protein
MSLHYNQSYTKKQVVEILNKIQGCILEGRYTIAFNEHRKENNAFVKEYNLNLAKQKNILLKIKPEDFCHSLKNVNTGFEHETLYVFCPQVWLFNIKDEEEAVELYVKFNIVERNKTDKIMVVSFHKRGKPVDYLFERSNLNGEGEL